MDKARRYPLVSYYMKALSLKMTFPSQFKYGLPVIKKDTPNKKSQPVKVDFLFGSILSCAINIGVFRRLYRLPIVYL